MDPSMGVPTAEPPPNFRPGADPSERTALWDDVRWAQPRAADARRHVEDHAALERKYDRPYKGLRLVDPVLLALASVCLTLSQGRSWGVLVAFAAIAASAAKAAYSRTVPWLQQTSEWHRERRWTWEQLWEDLDTFCERDAPDPTRGVVELRERLRELDEDIRTAHQMEGRVRPAERLDGAPPAFGGSANEPSPSAAAPSEGTFWWDGSRWRRRRRSRTPPGVG